MSESNNRSSNLVSPRHPIHHSSLSVPVHFTPADGKLHHEVLYVLKTVNLSARGFVSSQQLAARVLYLNLTHLKSTHAVESASWLRIQRYCTSRSCCRHTIIRKTLSRVEIEQRYRNACGAESAIRLCGVYTNTTVGQTADRQTAVLRQSPCVSSYLMTPVVRCSRCRSRIRYGCKIEHH